MYVKAPEMQNLGGLLYAEFRVLVSRGGGGERTLTGYSSAPLLAITSRYQWKDFLR